MDNSGYYYRYLQYPGVEFLRLFIMWLLVGLLLIVISLIGASNANAQYVSVPNDLSTGNSVQRIPNGTMQSKSDSMAPNLINNRGESMSQPTGNVGLPGSGGGGRSMSSGNTDNVSAGSTNIGGTLNAGSGINLLWSVPLVLILAGVLYLISSIFQPFGKPAVEENNESENQDISPVMRRKLAPAYVGVKGGKTRRRKNKIIVSNNIKIKPRRKKRN